MNSECNLTFYSNNIALISFSGSFIPESGLSAVNQALKQQHKDIILDLSNAKRIELTSIIDFAKLKDMIENQFGRFVISSTPAIFHLLNASLGDSYKFNIASDNFEAIRSLKHANENSETTLACY